MSQETLEQMVERIGIELNGGYQPSPIELRATVEFATRLRDELAKGQTPFAWHHLEEGLNYENHYVGNIPLYTRPFVAAPADAACKHDDDFVIEIGDGRALFQCNKCGRESVAGEMSEPANAVAKDAEAEYAIKESRRINSCEEYFGARPQIDCLDRRRVFEAGFDRGYDAAPSSAQEPDHYCVTRGDGECISNHPLCMHNRAAMQGKESGK